MTAFSVNVFYHTRDCQTDFIVRLTFKLNSLPKGKILDWSKLKAFANDKINVTEKFKFVLGRVKNNCGKSRKWW